MCSVRRPRRRRTGRLPWPDRYAENIGGASSHAENESPERLPVDLVAQAGDGAKGVEGFERIRRQPFVAYGFPPDRGELRLKPVFPGLRIRGRGFDTGVACAIEGGEGLVDARAVLAHVEPHGAEPKDADLAT